MAGLAARRRIRSALHLAAGDPVGEIDRRQPWPRRKPRRRCRCRPAPSRPGRACRPRECRQRPAGAAETLPSHSSHSHRSAARRRSANPLPPCVRKPRSGPCREQPARPARRSRGSSRTPPCPLRVSIRSPGPSLAQGWPRLPAEREERHQRMRRRAAGAAPCPAAPDRAPRSSVAGAAGSRSGRHACTCVAASIGNAHCRPCQL